MIISYSTSQKPPKPILGKAGYKHWVHNKTAINYDGLLYNTGFNLGRCKHDRRSKARCCNAFL